MKHYQINREERHFGFIFLTALISYPEFRKEMFALINARAAMNLSDQDYDVYAEVSIFRDHWFSLGDHNQYDQALHAKRLAVLQGVLSSMSIDPKIVNEEAVFWTGEIGRSKLWYPGKWVSTKIKEAEIRQGIDHKRLWRCKWLCNAKPDLMVHSGSNVLFIEVKVESGMGSGDNGYEQEQTQNDIISAGKQTIDWMRAAVVKRLNLTHSEDPVGITWKHVTDIFQRIRSKSDVGHAMIDRHLANMPKDKMVYR